VLIENEHNPDRGCIIEDMEINDQLLPTLINATDFDPEQTGAGFWREAYRNAGTKPTRDRLGM
jgi:hypothetical protein